MGIKKS